MTNTFIKDGEDVYAEAINGAQLFMAASTPKVTMVLPTDYDAATFLAGEQKVAFVLVNVTLGTGTSIASNKLTLTGSTGTVNIRVYPNLEPFKSWLNMTWTTTTPGTSSVTCKLYKNFGVTLVDSSYTSGEDMSGKGLGLEYVDFQFTLTADGTNKPTINSLTLQFTGGL